jgi:hypothetical protein
VKRSPKGFGTIKKMNNKYLAKFPIGRRRSGCSGNYETAYVTKSFTSKEKAQKWLDLKIHGRSRGFLPIGGAHTFQEYADLVIPTGALTVSFRTATDYYRCLNKHVFGRFGRVLLSEIDSKTLDSFFDELSVDYSESTVEAVRTSMSVVFRSALKEGHVSSNPVRETHKKRVRTSHKCSAKSTSCCKIAS